MDLWKKLFGAKETPKPQVAQAEVKPPGRLERPERSSTGGQAKEAMMAALQLPVEHGGFKEKLLSEEDLVAKKGDTSQGNVGSPGAAADTVLTMFMLAAAKGNADIVKMGIAAGEDVNAKNSDGLTALMFAAAKGNTDCVYALISANADVNAKCTSGYTALMWAVDANSLDSIKALIAVGADVNAKAKGGYSALMKAALNGKTDCAKVLVGAGADVNTRAETGATALSLADFAPDVAELLRQHGARQ